MATFDDFLKLDIRVGTIVAIEPFPRARNPSYKVTVDFGGEIGTRRSAAQATNYSEAELLNMQVLCVVNFEPKNIAGFMSEALILGVPSETDSHKVSLLTPSRKAVVGSKVY